MITNEYELAWTAYLVAALGCFWVWTFFTRWMWRYLREPLWLAVAVLLFSTTLTNPNGSERVPSIAMAAMDIAFKINNDAWRALADIMMYATAAFSAYLVFALLRFLLEYFWLKPRRAAARAEQADAAKADASAAAREPTLAELLEQRKPASGPDSGIVAER
ncbi:MAG: MFS transporter [Thiopseudomonas sp.]|nr:MFS transporter [Thiopseudomonas sp.]